MGWPFFLVAGGEGDLKLASGGDGVVEKKAIKVAERNRRRALGTCCLMP